MADPVFRQCTSLSLAKFLPYVFERAVDRGEVLIALGEPATETYLIVEGTFELSASHAPGKASDRRAVKRIDSGFLGEEAAIGLGAYTVTAVASQSSKVLVLPSHAIEKLAEQRPFRERLLASFAARKKDDTSTKSAGERLGISEVIESPRLLIGWFVVLLAPLLVYGQFSDLTSLPNMQALYLLCVISVTVTMWVFRLLPDFVPALFAVLCAILISQVPTNVALGGFASDSFFMAMSILGLSAVITISGLSFRALMALLRVGPAHKAWYNFCLFITGAALTPVVPTTNGRIAIVAPFFADLLGAFDSRDAKFAAPRLSGSVMCGISLLSAIFLSSKSVNFVIFSMLPLQEQYRFQWLYWLFAASVCGIILLTLYFLGSSAK